MKSLIFSLLFLIICMTTFSQTANYWVKKSDYGSDTIGNGLKRERAVAFTVDSFAYVGTGVDTAEVTHRDFWKYNPTSDSWTQVADLPGSRRRNAIAFSVNGYGYVGTGIDSSDASTPFSTKLNDFWQYNPSNNTWLQKANFPGGFGLGIYFATGFAIDSKGYICGGKMGPNQYSSELWEYKPALDQWTQLTSFPGGIRYQLSSFVIGLKAYVGLGTDQDMYRNDIWEFNAATNQWTSRANLPASERGSAMTFSIGQRGYVCMGTNGGMLDDLWEYNPFTDDWSSRAPYGGSSRKSGVGFSLNGKGYVGTGKGYSGKKASFQEYYPPLVVGIEELENHVTIYPNPAREHISLVGETNEINECVLYSSNGNEVLKTKNLKEINISHLESGSYLLVGLTNQNQIIIQKKIIIQ